MTYKEALLFVGKCLTLGIHPERATEIQEEIREGKVVWEQIVQISSGQFVLPALYLHLERASLLKELPSDLVEYMQYLTNLNRDRNQQILNQIKDITALLNNHGIAPIFLKGTAHLLLPLYGDIAERMVGDIDFLVEEKYVIKTAQLFINVGYQPLNRFYPEILKTGKHYPRLTNFNYPAAVEVHRQVIIPPYDKKFKSTEIIRDKQKTIGQHIEAFIPSNKHLIIHNVLNTQVNDKAYLKRDISLRQMYDLLLLSSHENPQKVLQSFGRFPHHSNAYLATASMAFDTPIGIEYDNNIKVKCFMKRLNFFLLHPGLNLAYKSTIYIFWRFSRYVTLPFQSIYREDVWAGLWFRLNDPKWFKKHILSYLRYFKQGS